MSGNPPKRLVNGGRDLRSVVWLNLILFMYVVVLGGSELHSCNATHETRWPLEHCIRILPTRGS
jgi:hypothetical protein